MYSRIHEILYFVRVLADMPFYRTLSRGVNKSLLCTVYGCADVTWLSNAWVRRHGDQIMVTCNYSGEVYYVTCDDNHWPLELINCSAGQLINIH